MFLLPTPSDCYAHALNGACNKAVTAAKKLGPRLYVEAALKKLREVCTYIKKSSVAFYWMSTRTITAERLEKLIPAMVKLQLGKVQQTPVFTQQKTRTTNKNNGGSELFLSPTTYCQLMLQQLCLMIRQWRID